MRIPRLAARANTAKQDATAETIAKIDAYLADNEKGVTKRQASLDKSLAELKAAQQALEKRAKAHNKSNRALRRMRWNPSQAPARLALNLIEGLASPGIRTVNSVDTSAMLEGSLPLVVAYEVLLAWALEDAGQHASAAVRRASAIAMARPPRTGSGDQCG